MRHKSMVQMSKKDWIEQKLVPNPDGEIIVETPIISRAHAGGWLWANQFRRAEEGAEGFSRFLKAYVFCATLDRGAMRRNKVWSRPFCVPQPHHPATTREPLFRVGYSPYRFLLLPQRRGGALTNAPFYYLAPCLFDPCAAGLKTSSSVVQKKRHPKMYRGGLWSLYPLQCHKQFKLETSYCLPEV